MIDFNNIKLYDAHLHIKDDKELEVFFKSGITGIVSLSSKEEFKRFSSIENENFLYSFGIHPWTADLMDFNDAIPFLNSAKIIGEIGLDNCWCNTDIDIQKNAFIKQLEYAHINKKSVILHTKGMEKEVLELIKKYDNKYLVHWYSSNQFLEEFINLNCFFTIGPSVLWDEAVINVAKKVPLNRILIETDGLSASKWAYENLNTDKNISYREVLINTIKKIATIKNIGFEDILKNIEKNFYAFKVKI